LENKDTSRRRFLHKISRLGLIGGIATLLLDQLTEKTIIPPVQAAGLNIDTVNTGTGTTQLNSSVSLGATFSGRATATTGSTTGVYGQSDSMSGKGVEGWATAATGYTFGVLGMSASTSGIGVKGQAGNPGAKPIVAQGAPGQTANLQEWQNNAGSALSVLNKDGWMGLGTSSPARSIHLKGDQACFRMDRNVNSSAFILVRTSPDFSSVWKTFYVGVDASAVNSGLFFIGDVGTSVSGPSARRLVIDNTGRVGIGTESPTQLLHVAGRVKATGYDTGDIKFTNDFTVTENEKNGLAVVNDAGEKIAVLDREGNLRIKGKVIEGI